MSIQNSRGDKIGETLERKRRSQNRRKKDEVVEVEQRAEVEEATLNCVVLSVRF